MRKFCLLLLLSLVSAVASQGQIIQNYSNYNNTSIVSYSVQLGDETRTGELTQQIQLNATINTLSQSVFKMSDGKTLGAFSTGDQLADAYIVDACLRHNIDPLLIYAQMNQESKFRRRAVSPKGAKGLMQLIPATAVRFGVKDVYDQQQNIEGGVKYMRWLLDKFDGDVRLALAAYNAGENSVVKYGYQIPPYSETQNYVARIVNRYSEIVHSNMASWQ